MSILKFRAWNRIVKRYQYFELKDIEFQKGAIQWQNIDIQQSTERKDKKGTIIYEGDILDHSDGNCKVQYDVGSSKFEVEFSDGCIISLWEATGYGSNNISIIGNICENPDMFVLQ
jgi:hypothetical protein